VWKDALPPGAYYLHPNAYIVTKVATSKRVYDYALSEVKDLSDPISVRSKDGFTFPVDVRVAVSISAEEAPYISAMLGNPDGIVQDGEDKGKICILEARLILPSIRTIFRNVAEKLTALQFVDSRSVVEKNATDLFIADVKQFRINTNGVFVGQIDLDNNEITRSLMKTRTDMEIALNQQKMYLEQERAQQERAKFTKSEEIAEQQKTLVAAQFQVDVQKEKSKAREVEAAGEAKYVEITFAARRKAYEDLCKAIGSESVTILEILKTVKEGNIQITPQVMVSGSSGDVTGALAGTILNSILKKDTLKKGSQSEKE
jgi:regulator of protease activity HflC (stomatin/prohibitin superfamily)